MDYQRWEALNVWKSWRIGKMSTGKVEVEWSKRTEKKAWGWNWEGARKAKKARARSRNTEECEQKVNQTAYPWKISRPRTIHESMAKLYQTSTTTEQTEKMASEMKNALELCGEHFKACSIEIENMDTQKRETLDLKLAFIYQNLHKMTNSDKDRLNCTC